MHQYALHITEAAAVAAAPHTHTSQCANGTYTTKAYGTSAASSCVTYTAVDWVSDSKAFAKSKGYTSTAFNLNLCVLYIKAKTNSTNSTLITKNLNNSLCNYGPYNVEFCGW